MEVNRHAWISMTRCVEAAGQAKTVEDGQSWWLLALAYRKQMRQERGCGSPSLRPALG